MTEQLQHAIEALQRLPASAQNVIASRILEEIEEQEWDAIVSKPHVQARLRELGRQAMEEDAAGETSDTTDAHKGLPYYTTTVLRAMHVLYSRVAPCGRPLCLGDYRMY